MDRAGETTNFVGTRHFEAINEGNYYLLSNLDALEEMGKRIRERIVSEVSIDTSITYYENFLDQIAPP